MTSESKNDWQPISRAQIERRLRVEKQELSPDVLKLFETHEVAITEHPCFRSEQNGTESVFLVARSGSRTLFFDDAEDEFAIGVPDDDGVLRDWGLYGSLMHAVPNL